MSKTIAEQVREYISEHGLPEGTQRAVAQQVAEAIGRENWKSVRRMMNLHGLFEIPEEAGSIEPSDKRHFYNRADDRYYFWLPCRKGKGDAVPGAQVREAKRRYSNWEETGSAETINEICKDFGWPREWFMQMKRELGWTHDQDPFTEEEHQNKDTEELLQDLAQLSRSKLERARSRKEWEATVEDAMRWRKLSEGTLEPLIDHLIDQGVEPRKAPAPATRRRAEEERLSIFHPTDIHLGKLAYSSQVQADVFDRVLEATQGLAERIQMLGGSKKQVLVVGNDWFHVDSVAEKTTAGTPQDVSGTVYDMVQMGYELAVRAVDLLKEHGPVEVQVVRSNHDAFATMHLAAALRLVYRRDLDVEVFSTPSSREYMRWGRNLIGFAHGHGAKLAKLPMLMASEAAEMWAQCPYRYFVTGHLHYARDRVEAEFAGDGVHILQGPSVSLTDAWHKDSGYCLGVPAMAAYTFDKGRGHEDRMLYNFG